MKKTPGLNTVNDLVDQLAAVREEQGLSLYAIAKNAGVPRDCVVRLFEGYRYDIRVKDPENAGRVQLGTLIKIANSLGFDLRLAPAE